MHTAFKRAAARRSERSQLAFRCDENEVRFLVAITSGTIPIDGRCQHLSRSENPGTWAALVRMRTCVRNNVHARMRGQHA